MGCIALVRCVLVLRRGLAEVVWCGIQMQAETALQPTSGYYNNIIRISPQSFKTSVGIYQSTRRNISHD